MRILGDYHTHTIYSKNNHGKSTIKENVEVAKKLGLKEIAITDHGYSHLFYGVEKKETDKIIKEIQEETSQEVRVLYGIEANILNFNGDTDIDVEKTKKMDLVLMGYHSMARKHFFNGFFFHYLNYLAKFFGTPKWLKNKNTKAYLKAIEKYDIDVITHINTGVKVNIVEIAKKCKENNVYVELNGKRLNISRKDLKELIELKCKFLINSDAHNCNKVGYFNKPLNYAIINQIPRELICNINDLPKFKRHKE
ncbi:MAG: PHP domain-containing protein [Clostridia bacterium]|nr:PHP domain-containing protein [Clostridia bacterium]